jgi:uncharacterized protein (DUF924 family)
MAATSVRCMQKCLDMLSMAVQESTEKCGAEAPPTMFMAGCLDFSQQHYDVVKQWSRFPHRNKILGRENTAEEEEGLKNGTIRTF